MRSVKKLPNRWVSRLLPFKSILITGASSGIGAALARHYAAAGITLILTARNETRLNAVANDCRARGAVVQTLSVDVRDRLRMKQLIEEVDAATPIDLVIANAGIAAGAGVSADDVFAVNVNGVLNTIHPLIPRMVARGRGHIAIMSSLASIYPLPSAPAYSASKAAVRYYGDALRASLAAHRVHVSVICPGWIATPLTDQNTFPMPLMMSASHAASIIARNVAKKKKRIAFPKRLYFPLCVFAALPFFMAAPFFDRLPSNHQES
jgi:short-subunit dehydrogenase